MKFLKIIAVLSLAAAVIFQRSVQDELKTEIPFSLPGTRTVRVTSNEFAYYKIYDKTGEMTGFVFSAEKDGYSGLIKCFIVTDNNGIIQKIDIFEHSESPEYVTKENLNKFLNQLKGKKINQGIQLHDDIDAITKATITSFSIVKCVNKTGKLAVDSGIIKEEWHRDAINSVPTERIAAGLGLGGIILLLFFSIVAYLSRKRFLRWTVILFTLIYLGFIHSYILTLFPVLLSILIGRVPPFSEFLGWYLIYGFALGAVLLRGRFYCGWICPFGAAQDFLSKLNPLRKKILLPHSLDKYLKYFKYLLLWGLLFFALIFGNPHLSDYEPFATLFTMRGSVLGWSYLLFFLVVGIFISRFWCRYFCGSGAGLAYLSRFSIRKLQIKEGCIDCRKCIDACPMGAISNGACGERLRVTYSECIECNRCRQICPSGAIVIK